jgi:hypothetical protein
MSKTPWTFLTLHSVRWVSIVSLVSVVRFQMGAIMRLVPIVRLVSVVRCVPTLPYLVRWMPILPKLEDEPLNHSLPCRYFTLYWYAYLEAAFEYCILKMSILGCDLSGDPFSMHITNVHELSDVEVPREGVQGRNSIRLRGNRFVPATLK